MVRSLLLTLLLLPATAQAQGWGNVGQAEEPKGFSWTDPLFGGTWMAWTAATASLFVFIFGAMGVLVLVELRWPGGHERKGVFRLVTTRGDRLFMTLLGSAYIFLAWLGLTDATLWGALALAVGWGVFCFWKA